MAEYVPIGEPVNDGERTVLRLLRDQLPPDWAVIANFEFPSGPRHLECDALVVSPDPWAYLVEIKAWNGRIRGNDKEWALPSMVRRQETYRTNPVHLLRKNVKKLSSFLGDEALELRHLRIQP